MVRRRGKKRGSESAGISVFVDIQGANMMPPLARHPATSDPVFPQPRIRRFMLKNLKPRSTLSAQRKSGKQLCLHYFVFSAHSASSAVKCLTRTLPDPLREKRVCNLRTTSAASSSSITKVRLISDAPCEIMRIFTSSRMPKTLAAIPAVSRKFSPPGRQSPFAPRTSRPRSSPNRRPARDGFVGLGRHRDADFGGGNTSTAMSCRSKASKMDFR